jgi:Mg2+-importing ATPase
VRTATPASRHAFWASTAHPALVISSLAALAVALVLVAFSWRALFGFAPLPLPLIATIVAIVATYLLGAEVAKRFAIRGEKA